MADVAGAVMAGAVCWTLTEYAFHRWFHVSRHENFARRKHLAHHARQDDLVNRASVLMWGAVLVVGLVVVPLLLWSVVPFAVALAFGATWSAGYFTYEWMHAADHLRPPRNAYGRWIRRGHCHHHFGAPLRNFGVTTPVWDLVFGTYAPVSTVVIPHRLAPAWLFDEAGGLKVEFADSYVLRGRPIRVATVPPPDGADAPH